MVVPKLESARQVAEVSEALGGRPVVAGLETVRGVADAREVLRPPVAGCYFGAEDYVADLGGARTAGNAEVAWARAYVAVAARLAGVPALDMVTIDFRDADGSRPRPGRPGRSATPGSCASTRRRSPSPTRRSADPEEVAWARRVLGAFEAAGGDTIAVEGEMVDEVVAARARAVLSAADRT